MARQRTGEHVLVLNDTAEILDLFKDLLEEEGYRVSLGALVPGELGRTFAEVKGTMPDAVVLDLLFGHEPLGWQLLQMLRMDRATVGLPIVVCTAAVARVAELSAHLGAMAVGVVIKPFDIDALLAELRRVLDRAKADLARVPTPKRAEE